MGLAKPQESSNEQVTVTRRGLESDTNSDGNKKRRSSYKERKGNALALGADEGRG